MLACVRAPISSLVHAPAWLDNSVSLLQVCIDQNDIGNGLKVLPVNVMACNKVLVLCGDTYTSRLWCMWELCTLFSFSSMQQALQSVVVETLQDGEATREGFIEELQAYRFTDAECYDPNEEAKILQVIQTVGAHRFNTRIRNMGDQLMSTRPHT